MQLVANQQLGPNRVRLGPAFHLGALGVFAVGLLISLRVDASRELPWRRGASIMLGLVLYFAGPDTAAALGPAPPPGGAARPGHSGLDDRYKLYAFIRHHLPDYIW